MAKLKLPKRKESMFANPLKRMAAFLIDILILQFVVISSFASYFGKSFPKTEGDFMVMYTFLSSNQGIVYQMYYAIIAMAAIILVYFAFMEYRYSQTIGMMLFKLNVESTSSKELTVLQCILRNIYLLPIFPVFFLWVIDPIYFLFNGERLSEKFSKTKTVEVINYGY
jgi:uncharacterized RDD family membrane protein YckC